MLIYLAFSAMSVEAATPDTVHSVGNSIEEELRNLNAAVTANRNDLQFITGLLTAEPSEKDLEAIEKGGQARQVLVKDLESVVELKRVAVEEIKARTANQKQLTQVQAALEVARQSNYDAASEYKKKTAELDLQLKLLRNEKTTAEDSGAMWFWGFVATLLTAGLGVAGTVLELWKTKTEIAKLNIEMANGEQIPETEDVQ